MTNREPFGAPMAAVLACDEPFLRRAGERLAGVFGPPLLVGDPFPFDCTDYYVPQTGDKALKRFLVFGPCGKGPDLAAWKRWAVDQERAFAAFPEAAVPRPVNLDPGLLTLDNLTLASTKERAHRVYLGRGIFAEVELLWEAGAFLPLPWTYPDYRTAAARALFAAARGALKKERRARE